MANKLDYIKPYIKISRFEFEDMIGTSEICTGAEHCGSFMCDPVETVEEKIDDKPQ